MLPSTLTLVDVNLQQSLNLSLDGTWRVVDRVLNRVDPSSPLAQATQLHLLENHLQLDTPALPATGNWRLERDGLLSRPYLLLQVAGENVRALITRLRHSLDGEYRALVLYFQSGLELFLVQP